MGDTRPMRFRIVRGCPVPVGPDEPREGLRRPCTFAVALRRCPAFSAKALAEFYEGFFPPAGIDPEVLRRRKMKADRKRSPAQFDAMFNVVIERGIAQAKANGSYSALAAAARQQRVPVWVHLSIGVIKQAGLADAADDMLKSYRTWQRRNRKQRTRKEADHG